MKRAIVICLLLVSTVATGVEREPLEQYRARRQSLASELDGVIVLFAEPIEDLVEYQQEDNFYYLTGIEQPGAILMLYASGPDAGEFLFLPPRDTDRERWTGVRLGPGSDAARSTGFSTVDSIEAFGSRFRGLAEEAGTVWALTARAEDLERLKSAAPRVRYREVAPTIAAMRQIKSATEIGFLDKAVDITMAAHAAAASVIVPGAWEYEAEAIIEYEFRRNGAERPGFPSIVGSGPNAAVLHYDRNIRQMQSGDLVVVDIGAEYSGYTADITRTYPVSGRFDERQREIYQVVLDAQKAALAEVRPGATFGSIHAAARDYIESKGYGEFFIHGTSHHIGLEVHDVGRTGRELEPDMVLTVEPGIYIPRENIGVRIEDDVLVTEDGYRMLSDFPREIEEIEALMAAARGQ